MAKPSQVIVLVEDNRQRQLVFRYLRRVGLETHAMRFVLPVSGSGEQWVREQFPVEVSSFRTRSARAWTSLIVVIDADNLTIQARLNQLDQKLQANALGLIRADEQIVRLIPRRNVETWILCLNAVPVNEATDYKRGRNDWNELVRPAAKQLYVWTRPNTHFANNLLPSLRQGIDELRRLDFSAI